MPELTLPPGQYYIGDPCLVIPDGEWLSFLKSIDQRKGESHYQGWQSAVFGTRYGDGGYLDESGRRYSVESGMIAAVPRDLASNGPQSGWEQFVHLIDSEEPLDCSADDQGRLKFGDITICTGP